MAFILDCDIVTQCVAFVASSLLLLCELIVLMCWLNNGQVYAAGEWFFPRYHRAQDYVLFYAAGQRTIGFFSQREYVMWWVMLMFVCKCGYLCLCVVLFRACFKERPYNFYIVIRVLLYRMIFSSWTFVFHSDYVMISALLSWRFSWWSATPPQWCWASADLSKILCWYCRHWLSLGRQLHYFRLVCDCGVVRCLCRL